VLPNSQPGGPVHSIYNPRCRVTQLYPQERGTHFGRLLRPEWATVGLIFSPVTTRVEEKHTELKKFNEMQQYADIYLLLNYSTCLGRPSRQSSGVHKTLVVASGTDHTIWGASFFKRDQITSEKACFPDSMICTRCCNYNFMYSWWLARWTPETCRVI